MHTRYTRFLILIALSIFSVASCKSEFSEDLPLPATTSPSVFISSDNGFVYALNPVTGAKKWEFYAGAAVKGVPYLFMGRLYVVSVDGYLHRLDPETGMELKSFHVP